MYCNRWFDCDDNGDNYQKEGLQPTELLELHGWISHPGVFSLRASWRDAGWFPIQWSSAWVLSWRDTGWFCMQVTSACGSLERNRVMSHLGTSPCGALWRDAWGAFPSRPRMIGLGSSFVLWIIVMLLVRFFCLWISFFICIFLLCIWQC